MLLFLYLWRLVETIMDCSFFNLKEAICRDPRVDVCEMWGVGWEEERIYRARIGQKIALSKYTTKDQAESFINTWYHYLNGRRGSWYPFQHGLSGKIYVNRKKGINF